MAVCVMQFKPLIEIETAIFNVSAQHAPRSGESLRARCFEVGMLAAFQIRNVLIVTRQVKIKEWHIGLVACRREHARSLSRRGLS